MVESPQIIRLVIIAPPDTIQALTWPRTRHHCRLDMLGEDTKPTGYAAEDDLRIEARDPVEGPPRARSVMRRRGTIRGSKESQRVPHIPRKMLHRGCPQQATKSVRLRTL